MQCSSCGTTYSKESDHCPECEPVGAAASPDRVKPDQKEYIAAKPKKDRARRPAQKHSSASTLIEFPGGGRVPQWRKELSERVREVQKRRALEAAPEASNEDIHKQQASRASQPSALGLVPQAAPPSVNPIVKKALLRIERAHRAPAPTVPSFSRGGPALARLPEENAVVNPLSHDSPRQSKIITNSAQDVASARTNTERPAKEHGFVVVPPQSSRGEAECSEPKKIRLIADGVEDAALSYLENLPIANTVFGTSRDDRASFASRIVAALIDLIVVAFASGPFAAAVELWRGNWNDFRIRACMAGIVIVVMFLYLTVATALTGRTLGMRLLRVRAVDVRTGLMPSGAQSTRRAIGYIFSLATAGLGILYGLVDTERRTAHDHFSGTIVVHD